MQPVVLLDVDGVVNLCSASSNRRRHLTYHAGWTQRKIEPNGVTLRLFFNPAHGAWLRALVRDSDAELVWGTTWNDLANYYVGPYLGLPKLPVAPCSFTEAGKIRDEAIAWTAGRPFVWFDDDPHAADSIAQLTDQPHLVVLVDGATGLTEADVAAAREWLHALKSRSSAE